LPIDICVLLLEPFFTSWASESDITLSVYNIEASFE
jgi:hypothetical protein